MTTYSLDHYTSSDWPRVALLLGGWAFKPFAGHERWPAEKLLSLCLARADSSLESNQYNAAWIARMGHSVLGLTSLTELEWDSRQIGMYAARIDYLVAAGSYREQYQIKQNLIATALKHGAKRDIQHFSARLDASDLSGLHALEQAGFITVDCLLTFALDVNSAPATDVAEGINIRLATGADSEATAELARKAYIYDRFHADPAVPADKADELHAEWLRDSCAGRAVDAVILAEDEKGLAGFVTCKLQRDTASHLGKLIGTIVLVATARRARGRGIARATTLAALEWFRAQSVEIVEVGTQLRNIPASRVYQSCGFRLVGSSISLRKLF